MLIQRIVEKLDREGRKIDEFYSNLTDYQLNVCVYFDEQEWQIRDILAHFISSEKSFLILFENIRKGGHGITDDFSINEFNNSQVLKMKGFDSKKLISLFRESRRNTIEWLNELSEEELQKAGKHPAMGEATLGEMVKMIYLHNQMHIRDIRIALG